MVSLIEIGSLATAIGLIVTIIFFIISIIWQNSNRKQETYQKLELAQVELFRFEVEQRDKVNLLWKDNKPLPKADEPEYYVLRGYVCQMLNLFEMAVRFRMKNLFQRKFFNTWIIQIYDLCSCARFRSMWTDMNKRPLRLNYLITLQEIIDIGINNYGCGNDRGNFFQLISNYLNDKSFFHSKSKHLKSFFESISNRFNDKKIMKFYNDSINNYIKIHQSKLIEQKV